MNRTQITATVIGASVSVASAQTDPVEVLTFAFTDIIGEFDADTNSFNATANERTAGDVTRTISDVGTADFAAGNFSGTPGVNIDLTLTEISDTSFEGVGDVTITDADGDTITAELIGTFSNELNGTAQPFFIFYTGQLANVMLTDNGEQDGTFDGADVGSFDLDFATIIDGTFTGAAVEIFFEPNNFFEEDFTNDGIEFSGVVNGTLVPTPGAVGCLAAGAVALVRRRRR